MRLAGKGNEPQDKAADLQGDADRIAEALSTLALRVRQQAKWLVHAGEADRTAIEVVAELQNDLTQGFGQIGPLLWTLIRDAGTYDQQVQAARIAVEASKEGSASS